MTESAGLLRKLQIKSGARLWLINVPLEIAESLARQAIAGLPEDGLLWFGFRKGGLSELSRDAGWDALAELGYRPVRAVSFDATWSGLRFRSVDKVKEKKAPAAG